MEKPKKKRTVTPGLIAMMLLAIVLVPLLPLLISWHWDWWQGWAFFISYVLSFVFSRLVVARRNPDLIKERAATFQQENTQPWDRKLAPLLGVGGALMAIVAGLDELLQWTPEPGPAVSIIGLVVTLAGYALASYALAENRYFAGTVRLQPERGQQVITGGPYRWMRHPGYAGSVIADLATPLLLGSWWAFLPAAATIIILVVRTGLEDRFLQGAMPGYKEYARRVRFRLLPGVW